MIGWPSCCLRLNAAEAQSRQIKLIDKDIDRPDRIILAQIVIQPFRKQRALTAVIPNDKARHRILRPNRRGIIPLMAFSHSLGQKQSLDRLAHAARQAIQATLLSENPQSTALRFCRPPGR